MPPLQLLLQVLVWDRLKLLKRYPSSSSFMVTSLRGIITNFRLTLFHPKKRTPTARTQKCYRYHPPAISLYHAEALKHLSEPGDAW